VSNSPEGVRNWGRRDYKFITESGESYEFWIQREILYNSQTHDWHDALTVTTRPYGYIFEIIKSDNGYVIDWDNWSGKPKLDRKPNIAAIPGYVEYLDKFVKLMVFI
jgi:hypothetical protein